MLWESRLGIFRFQTAGSGEVLQGSALLESDNPASGIVRFEIEGIGVAGVSAAHPLRAAVVPVRLLAFGNRSALALRNTGSIAASYDLKLMNISAERVVGLPSAFELLPGQSRAFFIDELFPAISPAELGGSLVVTAHDPSAQGEPSFAAVSLEMGSQPGQLASVPVTPLEGDLTARDHLDGEHVFYMAQFGNGEGLRSEIVFSNPSPTVAGAGLQLFDSQGRWRSSGEFDIGTDGLLGIIDTSPDSLEVGLFPQQTRRLFTSGLGTQILGSAVVYSETPLGVSLRLEVEGIGIAGTQVAQPLQSALVPVQRTQSGLNTAVAMRNTGQMEAEVSLKLLSSAGQQVPGGAAAITIPPSARSALFIDELFPQAELQGFQGAVLIESDIALASLALELGQPGQFTTMPVVQVLP